MLRNTLNRLNIPLITFDSNNLPQPKSTIEVFPNNLLPLYGEPLVGEKALLKQIFSSITPLIVKLNNLIISLGSPQTEIEDLIIQLQLGRVVCPVFKEEELDYDKLGYLFLKELADKIGINFFYNEAIIVDSLPSSILAEFIVDSLDLWFNNNVPGETGLDQANFILQRKKIKKYEKSIVKEVIGQDVIDTVEITWEELELFKEISSPTFESQILIYFRLGFLDINVFDYMLESVASNVIAAANNEINGVKDKLEDKIITNQNLQKQEQTNQAETTLKSEESTTSKPLPKQRKTKETDKI